MFSKITQFNLLFALLVLIVFSASLLSEIDAINSQTIISLLLFGILMFSLMGMADVVVINYMRQWFSQNLLYALVPLAVLYILTIGYIALVDQLTIWHAIIPLIYLFLPALLLWWDRHSPQYINWRNLIAILVVWFFIELGLVPKIDIPPQKGISFFLLIALNGIIFSFVVIRGLDSIGYRLLPNVSDWRYACLYLGLFVAFFVIPIGFSSSFIRQTTEWQPFWKFPIILLGIFLFTGLPEEIVFRGLIHNLLAGQMKENRSELPALLISSVIFGLAHINNSNPPFAFIHLFDKDWSIPWAYVILATIAGWFYGLAYIRTGSILAPAILHAMVDGWWVYFFNGN